MARWLKWLAAAICLIGLAGAGYYGYRLAHPRKVLVVVDGSYPMRADWERLPALLQSLSAQRYSRFALATDRGLIHGWAPRLELGNTQPYAPRRLAESLPELRIAELKQADTVLLITNAPAAELPGDLDWQVVRPPP